MKLQEKTSLIIVILFIVLLAIISIFVSFVSMASYNALEQRYVVQDVNQAVNRLNDEYISLTSIVSDWAPWDDTYAFVNGEKPDYVSTNLLPAAYTNLRVNLIVMTNTSGDIVYAGLYDLSNNTMIPVPESLGTELTPSNPLLNMTDPMATTTGVLILDKKPFIVASRPIIHSDFSGTPTGVVIMGRYLGSAEVAELAKLTKPDLSFIPSDSPAFPREFLMSLSPGENQSGFVVTPLNSSEIAGYALIRDVNRRGVMALEIQEPRDIYQQGLSTTLQYVLIVLGAGLLFGIVMLLLLNRLVLSRVHALSRQVHDIDRETNLSRRIRIGGTDEFSDLAGEMNHMLETIEKFHEGLVHSEERFRDLAELLPQTIFEMDLQGSLSYVNRAGQEVFGITPERIRRGTGVRDYLVPEEIERMHKGLAYILSGAKSSGEIYHLKKLDGTIMSAIIYTSAIFRNGSAAGFRGSVIDVTERVKLEEALRESEEKYRALTENTPDILYSTDMNGIITYASPQINQYGFLEEDVVGKPFRVFIHPADVAEIESNFSREIKNGAQFNSRFRLVDKWGTSHWFEEKSSLRLDESGKPVGIYGILRDISERKKAEDAIEIANKKLNLMNQITRHDIINAITGLLGSIDMLKSRGLPQEGVELLNDIRDLTLVIQRQISFTREYQEVGVHLPQWQDVHDLITRTAQNFAHSGITFHYEFENIEIYADPLLEKVFYNLIDNAVRYGEKITSISVYSVVSDKELSLVFEDDGVGVEPAFKREIFERGVGKNTGMGLFLTAEILAITGITIEENGIYGTGARFELRIPVGYWRFVTTVTTK
ncbi:PAS domain S-box protein [Methanoregula sp.]|uniref:sensor histidine kinase n=1 Tax=Methanoregula sp. TaxID=2052170 RepID=UPI002BA1A94E|nr:PAS domain S-box protein [Methanoregula sp.]HVP96284.1 PAS domain S-box protein [Methanoregula sp.]